MTRPVLVVLFTVMLVGAAPHSLQSQEPSAKERFDYLSTSLAKQSDEYVNDTMKTISFLLLIMGWLITSENSRTYLRNNRLGRRAALTTIPAVAVLHTLLAIETYGASKGKMAALRTLDYLGPQYYADNEITLTVMSTNLAIHLVLFGTLFLLVWASKGASSSP